MGYVSSCYSVHEILIGTTLLSLIISCIAGIFACIGGAVMVVVEAVVGFLECIVSGKYPLHSRMQA